MFNDVLLVMLTITKVLSKELSFIDSSTEGKHKILTLGRPVLRFYDIYQLMKGMYFISCV